MLPLSAAVKIYYCRTPINLHKSFYGLPGAVRQYLEADPASGHLFVFFNRTFNTVSIMKCHKCRIFTSITRPCSCLVNSC